MEADAINEEHLLQGMADQVAWDVRPARER
jgi:hypothetical protein